MCWKPKLIFYRQESGLYLAQEKRSEDSHIGDSPQQNGQDILPNRKAQSYQSLPSALSIQITFLAERSIRHLI